MVFTFLLIGGSVYFNIYYIDLLYEEKLKLCQEIDVDSCMGFSVKFKDFIFYFLIAFPGLVLIKSLIYIRSIIKVYQILPFCNYLLRNRYTYFIVILFWFLKVIISVIFFASLGL